MTRWFKVLNKHFKVLGRPSFFYKPVEPNRTMGVTSQLALERLHTLLKSKHHAFIYHCYNHYFCPVGFEREPTSQERIYYSPSLSSSTTNYTKTTTESSSSEAAAAEVAADEFVEWILVAETSRKYPAFHCFKWEDIERDLSSRSPEYVNIRKLERGVQKRGAAKTAGQINSTDATPEAVEVAAMGLQEREANNEKPSTKSGRAARVRRSGQNLHCIMMFQSFDSSSWQVPDPTPDLSPDPKTSSAADNNVDDVNSGDDSDSFGDSD